VDLFPSRRLDVPFSTAEALPITTIERRTGRMLLDVPEVWRFRELLVFLTWRDIKVRYKQTVLGFAWAILQPLATMAVFTVFLGPLAAAPAGNVPYPLFVFAGLLPWMFFSNAITSASQSIISSQNLVTKTYFPRILIPMSAVAAGLVDLGVAFGVLLVMMPIFGWMPGLGLFVVPLLAAGLVVAALGIGSLLAALTVAYRDFRHAVPFLIQLWMFATPAIYIQAETVIGPRTRALLPLNPVYGFVTNFRRAVLSQPLDGYALALSSSVAIVLLVVGFTYFAHVEQTFADII
jgi:lipopolysaccharide transport system permease protein